MSELSGPRPLVRAEEDGWVAARAHRVSYPGCDQVLTLPGGAKAGDLVECGGQRYRLTLECGAFAADLPEVEEER